MISVQKTYETFLANKVDFFTGVPDSLLQSICAYITDNAADGKNIIAANEGSAVGVAAGYHMATGKIPLVYMQNSGIGNAVNPLLSLADAKVYSLPILLMIGWRGEPGFKDEPQHVKQGEVTLELLDSMKIPYVILESEEETAMTQITNIIAKTQQTSSPHAIIIRKDVFGKYKLQNESINTYSISREEALQVVIDTLDDNAIVVSTTGKLSRELFEYRETQKQSHEKDFLTVGSMGHSSSIALGIALEKKSREVYCLDGDGAFIMHMGGISNVGDLAPKNFKHIIFNNGAHESVGGQPTLGFKLDINGIALACGYKQVLTAVTKEEIESQMALLKTLDGPVLLHIKVAIDSRDNLGRPTISAVENKSNFMQYLNKE